MWGAGEGGGRGSIKNSYYIHVYGGCEHCEPSTAMCIHSCTCPFARYVNEK